MSFEAKEKSVDKLLNDAIYCIPRNQRRYVWESQQWKDLYEDIELVVEGMPDPSDNILSSWDGSFDKKESL